MKLSRKIIAEIIGGGELQSYAPQKKDKILALCVNMDKNPNAPAEIYVGTKPMNIKKAQNLSRCIGVDLPVYTKDKNGWIDQGNWIVDSVDNDAIEIQKAQRMASRNITYVIKLKKVF